MFAPPASYPEVPAFGLNTAFTQPNPTIGMPEYGAQWPPKPFDVAQRQFHVWNSWYSNDVAELQNIYIQQNRVRPTAFAGGLVGRLQRYFWGRPNIQSNPRLHIPAASDISRASADLLFAEPPTITLPDDTAGDTDAAADRLQVIFGNDEATSELLEAAELASALGGVYLRLWWDEQVADHVMFGSVAADAAVPTWRYNKLYAVTFWSIVMNDNGKWLRHLERHEPGRILHALYEGDQGNLGRQVPLTVSPETAWAADVVDENGAINTGVTTLTASYIPNVRPNRLWRTTPGLSPLGRSDYDGLEPLFDALDEAYSSWMRDIDLGKARLFVDESLLQSLGPGAGATWDGEQAIFTPLRGTLGSLAAGGGTGVQANQFDIRWEQHSKTCAELLNAILRGAGLSTGSFSDSPLTIGAPTATEVNARENLSQITRMKKINLWKAGLGPLAMTAMQIDADLFDTGAALTEPPVIKFPTRSMQSPSDLATTLSALAAAQAISTVQMVTELHPDWSQQDIDDEVARIREEASAAAKVTIDNPNDPNGGHSPFPQLNVQDDPDGDEQDDENSDDDEPNQNQGSSGQE